MESLPKIKGHFPGPFGGLPYKRRRSVSVLCEAKTHPEEFIRLDPDLPADSPYNKAVGGEREIETRSPSDWRPFSPCLFWLGDSVPLLKWTTNFSYPTGGPWGEREREREIDHTAFSTIVLLNNQLFPPGF